MSLSKTVLVCNLEYHLLNRAPTAALLLLLPSLLAPTPLVGQLWWLYSSDVPPAAFPLRSSSSGFSRVPPAKLLQWRIVGTTPLKTNLEIGVGQSMEMNCEGIEKDDKEIYWSVSWNGKSSVYSICYRKPSGNGCGVQYKRYRTEGKVEKVNGTTIRINNVQIDESGNYMCEGVFSSERKIYQHVQILGVPREAPGIRSPSSLNVIENRSLQFECESAPSTKGTLAYSWWSSGKKLSEKNSNRWLNLTSISRYDAGDYMCKVKNVAGSSPFSQPVQLNVLYTPLVRLDATYIRKENDSVTLVCSSESNPNATEDDYHWTMDEAPLKPLCGPKCTLSGFAKEHAGFYTCTVTVDSIAYGPLTGSRTTQLVVQHLFISTIPDQSITEGNSFTLKCVTSANPGRTTFGRWMHYGPYINGSRTIKGTSTHSQSTLKIQKATYRDTGAYTCYARNDVDSKQRTAYVIVRFAPKSISHPSGTKVVFSQLYHMATMELTVFANPTTVTFAWFMDVYATSREVKNTNGKFQIMSDSDSSSLKVINITHEEFTGYTVQVSNNVLTESAFNFRLHPKGCPELAVLDDVATTAVSLTVSWRPQLNGGYKQAVVVIICENDGTNCIEHFNVTEPGYDQQMRTVIGNSYVVSSTCYQVRLMSSNEYNGGCLQKSPPTNACTKAKPIVQEEEFTVTRKDSIAFLQWSTPSADSSYNKQIVEQWQLASRHKRSHPECTLTENCIQTEVPKGTYNVTAEIDFRFNYRFILVLYDSGTRVFSIIANDITGDLVRNTVANSNSYNTGMLAGLFLGGLFVGGIILVLIFGYTLFYKRMLYNYLHTCRKIDRYKQKPKQARSNISDVHERSTTDINGDSPDSYIEMSENQTPYNYEKVNDASRKTVAEGKGGPTSTEHDETVLNKQDTTYENQGLGTVEQVNREYSPLAYNENDEHPYMDLNI